MSILKTFACAALLAASGGLASANTISATETITTVGDGSVGYLSFSVITAGAFDIFTDGPTVDPVLYLFEDVNHNGEIESGERLLHADDDGCVTGLPFCNAAGAFYNSLIDAVTLGVGSYVAAFSDFSFSEANARNGSTFNNLTGDITVTVTSAPYGDVGVARFGPLPSVTAVPLPAGSLLLLTGLAAFGLRRKLR